MTDPDQTSLSFDAPTGLMVWLDDHHATATELWVRIFKVETGRPSVTWNDCVVEAIRVGWIDGQRRASDAESFLQRLTPRKPRSNWSSRNRDHATHLIDTGRMTPAGLRHVDAAKADGRWDAAYDGSKAMVIPADFLDQLNVRPAAKAFYATLDRKNIYAIYYRLHTAKRPETRARRMEQMLSSLERGETLA